MANRLPCWLGCALMAIALAGCATTPRPTAGPRPVAHVTPSIWPLASRVGEISERFGARHGEHKGLDLRAPKGTPVVATADGTVIFAGRDKAYGRIVRIAHAHGIETRYAHLSDVEVKAGERVRQGRVIGRVGATGRATGFHLHYAVVVNGVARDPVGYLPR